MRKKGDFEKVSQQGTGDGGNQFSAEGDSGTYNVTESTQGEYNPFEPAVVLGQSGTPPTPEADAPFEDQLTDITYLRLLIQENVPEGMTDDATMFLDEHLVAILNRSSNVMSYAAYTAWSIKAGALLVLTDRNDGLSEKKLSQAAVAAQKQAAQWQGIAMEDVKQFGRTMASTGIVFRPYDRGMQDMWNQVWDVSHIDRFWLPWNVIEG